MTPFALLLSSATCKLEALNLPDAEMNGPTLELFVNALRTNTTLTRLGLANARLGNEAPLLIESLCENSILRALDLSRCAFGVEGSRAVSTMLRRNSTLRELNLAECKLDLNNSGYIISQALLQNESLRHLDLHGNTFSKKQALEIFWPVLSTKVLRLIFQ